MFIEDNYIFLEYRCKINENIKKKYQDSIFNTPELKADLLV